MYISLGDFLICTTQHRDVKKTKPEKAGPYPYVSEGLIRNTNRKQCARFLVNCKDVRKSLRTADFILARHRLCALRADLEQIGTSDEQLTLRQLCDRCLETTLHREPKTVVTKKAFGVPIYPKVRLFLEQLRATHSQSPHPTDKIFRVKSTKKALESACDRLQLPTSL